MNNLSGPLYKAMNAAETLESSDAREVSAHPAIIDSLNGSTAVDTMTGGPGDDLFIVDNSADVVIENPNSGIDTVQASVSYVLPANVENLILTGPLNRSAYGNELDNAITGNSGNNSLKGYDGNDTLDGGLGADTMYGGTGNDIYYIDNVGDLVSESLNQGTDTVRTTISYILGSNVENLTFLGSANINGTGNSLANNITGNTGDNILDGGLGADIMTGGLGNDTYVLDNTGDVVVENANEGLDTVVTTASYILGANVENLTLTGTINRNGYGNAADNIIIGNSGVNGLKGYDGNDTLDGGLGADNPGRRPWQ